MASSALPRGKGWFRAEGVWPLSFVPNLPHPNPPGGVAMDSPVHTLTRCSHSWRGGCWCFDENTKKFYKCMFLFKSTCPIKPLDSQSKPFPFILPKNTIILSLV